MTREHQQASILRAIADGKTAQYQGLNNQWIDMSIHCNPISHAGHKWRIKPSTILVNGIEIQAPETSPPGHGIVYSVPSPASWGMFAQYIWKGTLDDNSRLSRGIVHLDFDAANAHARAWLSLQERSE